MYRANLQRTGVYNTQGIDKLRGIKWKLKLDSLLGDFSRIGLNCPLIIADEVLYLCDLKGYLYAVNSQTGKEIWKIQIDNKVLDNLIFHDNIIYLSSADGDLYAIDVKTQQIKWKSPINFGCHPNPIVADKLLFANSKDGNLYAIDAETGERYWEFKTTLNMKVTSPALNNGVVYVGSEDGHLYAIDAETGKEKWSFEIGPLALYSIPIIAHNVVYIGIKHNFLYAIDAETGTEIWKLQVEDQYSLMPFCPPVIDNKFIYVGISFGYLCAINIETQKKSWYKLEREYQQLNSITLSDEIVYCERSGAINALEAHSGKELWKFIVPEPKWWFLNSSSWKLQILNIFSKWASGTSFIQFSSPVIADGIVYVLCRNGYLYALH